MRIGILSMQRVVNCGSFLQAYALRQTVEDIAHAPAEFIDFPNPLDGGTPAEESFAAGALKRGKHLLLPQYRQSERRKINKQKFYRRWKADLPQLGLPARPAGPSGTYDLVVVGSDEVFNLCQFTDAGKEVPWLLLGEGLETRRLISYAASCGQTDVRSLAEAGAEERSAGLLRRFDELSVRDENTEDTVRTLSGREALLHLDPVLVSRDFPRARTHRKPARRYLLVYAYSGRISDPGEIEAVRSFAKEKGLQIICLNNTQTWARKTVTVSPFDVPRWFEDAEYVVTDTFHGAVFSIRTGARFAVFVRNSNRNKLSSLLDQFDLEDRVVAEGNPLKEVLARPMDQVRISFRLREERNRTVEYLREEIAKAADHG